MMGLILAILQSDPDDARAREAALAGPKLGAYVFEGEAFPTMESATIYDAAHRPVDKAPAPGSYRAVVGRRGVTLFRAFAPLSEPVAAVAGVSPEAVARHQALLDEILKGGKTPAAAAGDPRLARFLAGLRESASGAGPARKWEDAYAADRPGWVDLKRLLSGRAGRPACGPDRIDGTPVRTVREGTAAEAGVKPDAADRIDAACRAWASDTDQAFAICVVRRGVIVIHRAYGVRDGAPITIETKSWMASVTKTMSATLMMMLVDRGLVELDDPVAKHVGALKTVDVSEPLRIRHLFTHTGGLARLPLSDEQPDVEARVADFYPHLKVGKEWAYGGTGNILGAKIVESISGEALPQFYRAHLLAPLGMEHTDVTGSHADARSVPLDMAKFGQMLLNRGSYGPWRFFREETFARMLPRTLREELGVDAKKSFGIGLDGKPNKFGHGTASSATFSVDVDRELVVIMTRNKEGTNQGKYNGLVWKAIDESLAP